jgi:hypothetical protein
MRDDSRVYIELSGNSGRRARDRQEAEEDLLEKR